MKKRVFKEIQLLKKESWIKVLNDLDQNKKITIMITAPDNCLYQGLQFQLEIYFPDQFPFRPPKYKFKTEIVHPGWYYGYFNDQVLNIFCPCCYYTFLDDRQWSPFNYLATQLQILRSYFMTDTILKFGKDHAGQLNKLFRNNFNLFKIKLQKWKKEYKQVTIAIGPQQEICAICYQTKKVSQQQVQLGCHHSFHRDCFKYLVHTKCPLCNDRFSGARFRG